MRQIAAATDGRKTNLFGWTDWPPAEKAPSYPQTPGWREPTTSRAAAEAITETAKTLRDRILNLLKQEPAGLSSDQIAVRLGLLRWSVRPRIAELRAAGKVQTTGQTTENETGRTAHVWRAA